jgi:hypothetical protein
MSRSAPLVALHGWSLVLPPRWELVRTAGSWNRGHVVLADERGPLLNLSWERRSRTVDPQRTAAALAKRIRAIEGRPVALEAHGGVAAGDTCWSWQGPDGRRQALLRTAPGLALVLRQTLAAGDLRQLARGLTLAPEAGPVPWAAHGLEVSLPAGWRLEGLAHLVGLALGVWFLRAGAGTQAVLTMRRVACASRILAGQELGPWLRSQLGRRDEVLAEHMAADGTALLILQHRRSRWALLGRRPRPRHVHAWVETDSDRLVVQEWTGEGSPLPCLRPVRATDHADPPASADAVAAPPSPGSTDHVR